MICCIRAKGETMRKILGYLDLIEEEINGSREYAEKYIEYKAVGNMTWADRFKEMSNDKLKISNWIHELTVTEIQQIKTVYTPTFDIQELWDKKCKKYVEEIALIKQMLSM